MNRERRVSLLGGQRPAGWFGPERVALALSVLVVIALAFVLGLGPFAAAPGSPTTPASPVPSGTRAGPWGNPRLAVGLPTGEAIASSSGPGRPAGTQS